MNTSRQSSNASNNRSSYNEETKTLIDWVSSIYGMVWGVWLGFFVEQIGSQSLIYWIPSYFSNYILLGFSLLLLLYTYHFIKWLWKMRRDTPNSRAHRAITLFGVGVNLFVVTIIAIVALGYIYQIPNIWIGMGVFSTSGWPIIIIATVYYRRGWNV